MTEKVLKAAVLGLGRIAWQYHIPEIIKHAGFELAAVVDPLPERLLEAAGEFNISACYATTVEMYASQQIDVVVIASPTRFHKAQALEAFEHGCDVFCDKPMSLSLEETDEMIAAMNKHGRKMMVYQPHRVTSEAMTIKWILASGLLGKIYMVKRAVANFHRRADWQAFRKNGGGMLNNYGAHYIDQFLYLNQSNFSKASCELRSIATLGDADDVVKAVLTAENGVIFDLDINMAATQSFQPWYIAGNCGSAVFDQSKLAWELKYFIPEELSALQIQEGMAALDRSYGVEGDIPWKTQTVNPADFAPLIFYDKCYDYFASGKPAFVPVTETREIMRIIADCRRSAGWQEQE